MPKRLLILIILITVGYAQNVGLGAVNLSDCTFGVAGQSPPTPPTDTIGAEWYYTIYGEPIGGGIGYSDTIPQPSNNHSSSWIVGTSGTPEDSLVAFLAAAGTGDTIYINDNVQIDRTGNGYLTLNGGVILASGRGTTKGDTTSWGALIYTDTLSSGTPLIYAYAKSRVTGLRLRGAWSMLEGTFAITDSVTEPIGSHYALYIDSNRDSVEVDNCECYGMSGGLITALSGSGHQIHHNYIHDEWQYQGYTINMYGTSSYRAYANMIDEVMDCTMFDGGSGTEACHGLNEWTIYGQFHRTHSVYYHSDGDSNSCDTLINCSFYCPGFYNSQAQIGGGTPARDTVYFENLWGMKDSVTFFGNLGYSNLYWKSVDGHYSTTPPEGVSALLPTAVIVADADSGEVPLTVKFTATGSTGGNDDITTFNWQFGDSVGSDNWARVTAHDDTVSHTYGEVGRHTVRLMVIDEEGIFDYAHKTILVKPSSDNYLSAWVYDNWEDNNAGYYKWQIKMDDWVVAEHDIAGVSAWEHVVVDVTDSLALKDSFDLTLQLLCTDDTTFFWQPMVFFDNVHIFGANVWNGSFDSTGITWSGGIYGRTDGFWVGSYSGGGEQWYHTQEHSLHCFGDYSYWCGTMWSNSPHKDGYYSKVVQRVDNPNVP